MKLIIGEGGLSYLERLAYRGVIGIFYESTLDGIVAFIITLLLLILAAIGLVTVIKTILFGFPKKKKW